MCEIVTLKWQEAAWKQHSECAMCQNLGNLILGLQRSDGCGGHEEAMASAKDQQIRAWYWGLTWHTSSRVTCQLCSTGRLWLWSGETTWLFECSHWEAHPRSMKLLITRQPTTSPKIPLQTNQASIPMHPSIIPQGTIKSQLLRNEAHLPLIAGQDEKNTQTLKHLSRKWTCVVYDWEENW